jgi:hypothetical protein
VRVVPASNDVTGVRVRSRRPWTEMTGMGGVVAGSVEGIRLGCGDGRPVLTTGAFVGV